MPNDSDQRPPRGHQVIRAYLRTIGKWPGVYRMLASGARCSTSARRAT